MHHDVSYAVCTRCAWHECISFFVLPFAFDGCLLKVQGQVCEILRQISLAMSRAANTPVTLFSSAMPMNFPPRLGNQTSQLHVQVMTREMLYSLCMSDMRMWAGVSRCAWELHSEHEREMEELYDDCYWDTNSEGWFSD